MKATIRDVASLANTSAATVSRVLTNKVFVEEDTRKAVLKAIKELGYVPPSKKSRQHVTTSDLVLVLVEDFLQPEYIEYLKGITTVLERNGKKVLHYSSDFNNKKEEEYLKMAQDLNCAGVIMLSAVETDSLLRLLEEMTIPVVFGNRPLKSIDADAVSLDNYKLGYMATHQLIKNGHKKIMHLAGPKKSIEALDRLRGYKDAMEDAGLKITEDDIYMGDFRRSSGMNLAIRLIRSKSDCTAVFSTNETMALGLLDTLTDHGIRCPEDISVICTLQTNVVRSGQVKLAGIGYDSELLGERSADLLLQRLDDLYGKKMHILISPKITENNSIRNLNEPEDTKLAAVQTERTDDEHPQNLSSNG